MNKDLLKDGTVTVPDSAWSEYLNYVDNTVLDGVVKAVAVRFGYLVDHSDHSLTPSPLMEVTMELNETELVSSNWQYFTLRASAALSIVNLPLLPPCVPSGPP